MTIRNATLTDLVEMLQDQHARKVDLVVSPQHIRVDQAGNLEVRGAQPLVESDGVTDPNGKYRAMDVFDDGLSSKLGIPRAYLRKMRADAPDLLAANVNGWMHGRRSMGDVIRPGVDKQFLLRLFRGENGPGVARALLSDRFGIIDNFDVVTAALQGIRDAGVAIDGDGISADLSDRKMFMRVPAPEIGVLAPTLLAGYRSPFRDANVEEQRNHGWNLDRARQAAASEGMTPDEEKLVFAGLEIRNSEVGDGSFTIAPVLTINVCKNGLTITTEALRRVHIGAKLEVGTINWSADTMEKSRELIVARTRDAVKSFLNVEFVQRMVDQITEQAVTPLEKPQDTVEAVSKKLMFSAEETRGILDHFMRGGQMTAGGVMQAMTSFSQTLADADRAHDLDDKALEVLELAAK
jgi:hypothetical protein